MASESTGKKDSFLQILSTELLNNTDAIINANTKDVRAGIEKELSDALIDRLTLTPARVEQMAEGVMDVMNLPDPVGEIIEGSTRANGLELRKVRIPIGVIGFIYESRPNVTVDASILALKSGNAIIMRGGKEARHSNEILGDIIRKSLKYAHLPEDALCVISHDPDHTVFSDMLTSKDIDLIIPRGGKGLIKAVTKGAIMPVLKHFEGICHLYVAPGADKQKAVDIVHNAKVQRPGVCNALETLLVDKKIAQECLPRVAEKLQESNVELRGCEKTRKILTRINEATEEDWSTEYLDLILSIKVVDNENSAIEHIQTYSSGHSDGIISDNINEVNEFMNTVNSAAIFVNSSTRFHDGFEFGLGAEMGISTDKLHARGPVGLRELTTYKWVVIGNGHVRG